MSKLELLGFVLRSLAHLMPSLVWNKRYKSQRSEQLKNVKLAELLLEKYLEPRRRSYVNILKFVKEKEIRVSLIDLLLVKMTTTGVCSRRRERRPTSSDVRILLYRAHVNIALFI